MGSQRPRRRAGRDKVGEERMWPRSDHDGKKGADGSHPGVLVDNLWRLMGRAGGRGYGEGGIKDEAQCSLRAWGNP